MDFDSIYTDLPAGFDFSTASISSFLILPFFTRESAQTVVALRDSLSPEFFQGYSGDIPGLSPMEYAILNQFSYSRKPFLSSGITGSVRQGVIYKPRQEHISESKYYLKFHTTLTKDLEINMIGERDSSEPRAFDLFSGNAVVTLDHRKMRIVLGDFRPGFGQGLLFSRYGRNYGNGAGVMIRDMVNVANTSYQETHYMRGGYVSVERKWFTAHAWLSNRRLDATVDESGDAVTIRESGYHFSGSNRGNLTERINGARFVITPLDRLSCAVTGVLSHYSPRLARKEGEPYFHDPEGSVIRHAAIDGKFEKGQAIFFLEHVFMDKDEHALIGGLSIVRKNVRSSLVFRHYSPGYHALRAGGFSAFGETSNEKGVYSAIQTDLPCKTRVIASMDLARMLYRRARDPLPASRKRFNIVIESRVIKNYRTWMSIRSTDDSETPGQRWNCRIALEKKRIRNRSIRWRSILAWSESGSRGGPYYESALFLHKKNFRCDIIGGIFDIPSYDSRYYRYEYDVPGRGYTRAIWGKGGTFIVVTGWGPFSTRYRYSDSDLMDTSQQLTFQFDIAF